MTNGYTEIRWKSGSSAISSDWWLYKAKPDFWTEIDMFESTGADGPPGMLTPSTLMSHTHIFRSKDYPPDIIENACNCKNS